MRKNKKLWSYALAGALAVSNLSGVVAAPFTTIVAQAAISGITIKDSGGNAITGPISAKQGSTVTLKVTLTGAAEGDTCTISDGGTIKKKITGTVTAPTSSVQQDVELTVPADADLGDHEITFTGSNAESTTTAKLTINVFHEVEYAVSFDGKAWASADKNVNPGKAYPIRITADGKDYTSSANISVKKGPATYSDGMLTVDSAAIENQTIELQYKKDGETEPTDIGTLTVKKGTSAETLELSLAPEAPEYIGSGAQTEKVLIGYDLPDGYVWGDGEGEPLKMEAQVLNGDGVDSAVWDNTNGFTITTGSVDQKSVVKMRYKVSGVAKPKATSSTDPKITYSGQIDQTVTVLPTPTYKLTIDGADYDASKTYTLMEEDGSITITAAVKPDGKDIPETDDVKFAWEATSPWLQVSPEAGATVTVSPKGTFKKANDGQITLTVTNKAGTGSVTGIDNNPITFTVKTDTTAKPTITASAQEVTPEDEVTFTVTGSDGKALSDYELYDGGKEKGHKITSTTGKFKFEVGSHKVTAFDTARQTESEAVTITSRSEDGVKATGLKISKDSVELNDTKKTDTVDVTVLPDGKDTQDPKKAEINTVTAKSADPKVATVTVGTVDENNKSVVTITGVAPGETTIEITADDKNVKDKKVINVTVAGYKGIVLTPESGDVEIGKTLKITADVQVYGEGASKDIVWHSTDESVATVKDGTVTGVAEGTAKIYATAKNDDSKKSNEVEITVTDSTVSDAIAAAEAAANKAVKDPTDANIQAAKDAVAAAKKAGASESALTSANEKIAQAEAANEAAKKAEEEAKKKAEEEAKAADDSAKGTPAPVGTELVDANGNKTGFKVTDANASAPEVEYEAPADKNATKADIPETYTDLSGNVYKVVGIDARAFKDTKVKTVTIRKNIKRIDPKAFEKSKVKNVKIKGTKLTKKMAKSFKKLKKGGKIKCSGSHKKKNKEILNNLSTVKNGKTKVK